MKIECKICGKELEEEYYFVEEMEVCAYCTIELLSEGLYRVLIGVRQFIEELRELWKVWGGFVIASQNDSKLATRYKPSRVT